jgi:hypothetical protein
MIGDVDHRRPSTEAARQIAKEISGQGQDGSDLLMDQVTLLAEPHTRQTYAYNTNFCSHRYQDNSYSHLFVL